MQIRYRRILPTKCVFTFLSFLGFVVAYIIRTNLSIAIIAMVEQPLHNITNGCSHKEQVVQDIILDLHPVIKYLSWSKKIQGYVLAAFFYGYILTQIPGGYLSLKYGSKYVLGLGILIASIFTLISPPLATDGPYAFMTLRLIQGMAEGVMLPSMHNMISKWSTPSTKTKMTTMIYSGIPIGTIAAMPMGGYLAVHGFAGGWPSIFYVTGILGCVWFILWCMLIHESPLQHPGVSVEKKESYLRSNPHYGDSQHGQEPGTTRIPVREIIRSTPFWAMCVAHVSHTWALYTLIVALPTYIRDVLGIEMTLNGIYSSLPFLAMWVFILVGGQLSDYLRVQRSVPTVTVRKILNSLGLFVPATLFVAVSYVKCDQMLAMTLITIAGGFLGFTKSGFMVNPLDLSPKYSGVLLSVSNTFATLSGIISPSVTSALIAKGSTSENWRHVFLVSAAIMTIGGTVFACKACGEEQPWSKPKIMTCSSDELKNRVLKPLLAEPVVISSSYTEVLARQSV